MSQQFVVSGGDQPLEINLGDNGGTVTCLEGTVYYRDEPFFLASQADGSLLAGESIVLTGSRYLFVAQTSPETVPKPRATVQVVADEATVAGLAAKADLLVSILAKTQDYAPAAVDAGKLIAFNSSSALLAPIATGESLGVAAHPVGFECELDCQGTGSVTVVPASGVEILESERTITQGQKLLLTKMSGPDTWSAIVTGGGAETADRQAADAAHVAATDPHGDRKLAALLSMGRFFPAMVAAHHSLDSLSRATVDGGNGLNVLTVTPVYSGPAGMTLNNWKISVTTGVATSKYRIGVWTIVDQTDPLNPVFDVGTWATLLVDLGQFDCATSGAKTITTSVALPADAWFLVGGVLQTAASTVKVGTATTGISGPFGSGFVHPSSVSATGAGLKQFSVSGVFGSFTPNDVSDYGHGIGANRAA